VGTGAGEGATGQDTGTAWVTRSTDCPEAPAQAHPLAEPDAPAERRTGLASGTCTACGHPAEQAPSGRWWHLGPACPNRSQTVFAVTVVEDGVMRETTDAERPARFRADD
jgi:hypothetical protein